LHTLDKRTFNDSILKINVMDEIYEVDPLLGITKVRAICGGMMFSGKMAEKEINILSGGERSRVMLGKIIATPANLLFLDEPTNHLDMYSIDSLCEAIKSFEGSTIFGHSLGDDASRTCRCTHYLSSRQS